MGKTIICRCEDVTEAEIKEAIARGYADIESLKRYLAIGTGPCQGKTCLATLAEILLMETGRPPETLAAITARPPLTPISLERLAGDDET